ncbi:response regulator transcription factor [Loktanella sp. F6476L]|uniref:response regulator transcription factor n=1 Tax=Loktanella sp. F6476L TaxID=2926405 RepID=UPI001FF0F852|nr:response regulator transcription factor [Loktanella sp. F6476L]MCK0118906.1 response regulator transcription factor [Loktanella sp. F6476L]
MKILLVDDDPRLRELVRLALERATYTVITASDGQIAVTQAAREAPDLIVLDIGLPEMDGFEVCRRIRFTSDVPIIFLTARDDEVDKVLGLELGADDYVTKPFSPRELVARVKAILKRTAAGVRAETTLTCGPLSLDVSAHKCQIGATTIALTATEFDLLGMLARRPASVQSRTQLIHAIWGERSQVSDRTLDSHLRNVRSKLAKAGWQDAIETVHGVGFRMRSDLT